MGDTSATAQRTVGGPQWFCVYTVPDGEQVAHIELSRAGWEAFVPVIWRPATRRLVPLFRRYGFVRFDMADRHWQTIWRLPGPVTAKVCVLATRDNSRDLSKVLGLTSSKVRLCGIDHPVCRTAKCQKMWQVSGV